MKPYKSSPSSSGRRSRSRARPSRLWWAVGVLVLAAAGVRFQEEYGGGAEDKVAAEQSETAESPAPEAGDGAEETASVSEKKSNGYIRLDGCRMVDHRNNDGDSFWVRHQDKEFELRLYFADTPEKYLSDRYADQRRRVGEQAREFGGISVDQAVELGKAAKLYVGRLLEGKTFTVYTKWERVYQGERFYGWVVLPGGEEEYLSERLVDKGVARIHTKGAPSPDGLSSRQYESHLRRLEASAKEADRGGWGLN